MKKVLILMSDTGGGHRASAQALQAGFAQRFGDHFQVEIVDLWMKHTPFPLNQFPKSYSFLATRTPWAWKFIWRTGGNQRTAHVILEVATRYARKSVEQLFREQRPDLVISVHPLMQDITLAIQAHMGWDLPFVTVITDLASIHPTWFHRQADLCFVASPEAFERGVALGMRPEQLRLFGLPIRPVFAQAPRPKATLRQELGMDPDLPAALIVGGGEGMGAVAQIARSVADGLAGRASGGRPQGQVVVVCGRNQKLKRELAAHDWPVPVIIHGFVDNMPDWMTACDCIVTKAGPGTIAEALVRGLPILLSGFIPGQEEGNVPYVVDNGAGAFSTDPEEIARVVARWFGPDREQLAVLAERAKKMGNPDATLHIVEEVAKLVDKNRLFGNSRG